MRATLSSPLLILAAVILVAPAHAQTKKDAKEAKSANDVRYFTSIGGILDDQADTVLKETRAGGKVTGAVLDVCYPAGPNSERKDRFVATLTVEGNKLTGATESIGARQPVTIALTRKAAAGGVAFDGKVTIGGKTSVIASPDNTDISEKEFNTGLDADDELIAAPADYSNASPEAVAVRLKPDDVAAFVGRLRGQNVQVTLGSLLPSCAELRREVQTVHFNIDPERAADFVTRMKAEPGVVGAGWTSGKLELERSVRFDAGAWREGGKLSRDKLVATLSGVLAKALAATALDSKWDEDSGELTLTFKRPFADLPTLGLTQTVEFTALVAAEKPTGSDKLVLWLSSPTLTTRDESAGPRLKIADATSDTSAEDSAPVDEGDVLTAVARALKAQRWDADNSSWK
jgi:hypothetical protein